MPRPFFVVVSCLSLAVGAASFSACASGTVEADTSSGSSGNESSGGSGGASPSGSGGADGTTESSSSSESTSMTSSTSATSSASGGTVPAQACPPGQLAKGLSGAGTLQCEAVDIAARAAVNAGCAAYLGQSDKCTGCSSAPAKWGFTRADDCMNGAGADSTCAYASLGGKSSLLFGLNTDGDVDGNDKLYLGFACDPGSAELSAGPCAAGSFAVGMNGKAVTCARATESMLGYVRESCSLYFGQRDDCDGCTLPPARWGRVSSTSCDKGVGSGNTCIQTTLGGSSVTLLSLGIDGDVDGNDKLYLGMHCIAPQAQKSQGNKTCPKGQFISAIEADGSLTCESPAATVASFVSSRCELTFGVRDACDGCSLPPAKWGRVRDGACDGGEGANDTCVMATLGSDAVTLFGLNTVGDMDDNDKLYIGVRCE